GRRGRRPHQRHHRRNHDDLRAPARHRRHRHPRRHPRFAGLAAIQLPVYAAGVTHRGPYKDGPGEINAAIALDGMIIEPGDLIVGAADGLLCVPFDRVDAVYQAAAAKQAAEARTFEEIAAGTLDTGWIDARLAE